MTTDQVSAPPKEQQNDRPKPKRPDAVPAVEKAPNKKPKDDKAQDGGQPEEKAQDDGQQSDSGDDDAENGPAGTRLIATLLTRASDLMVSERALADATIALQINNLPAGQGTALRRESVGTNTLLRVRRTFVAPENLGRAWDVLAEHHLLLLRGSPGDGREHLATFLLDAFCDARVRRLENGSLADLDGSDLTSGGGHLWPGPIGDRFDQRVAETLAGRLRKLAAQMVVVWPNAVEYPAELGDYAAEAGRPDLGEVLRRHLTAAAEPLMAVEGVAKVRKGLAGAHHAAQFAGLLGQVAAGQKPLEAALAEADGPIRGIPDWFADLPEREDKAFALALAALDDLSLPSVVTGARLVDELIQRLEDPEGRYGLRPFRRPTNALLAAVGAECVSSFRETSYGRVPVTAVRLRRRGSAREMLDAFWLSFPYLQEIYLEWMNALARHQDEYVRERVAFAAGLLAAYDFDFVRGRLLLGWASDADPKLRRAAATALRPSASNEGLREIVWGLLDQWSTIDENDRESRFHQRLTAATALGGPVGARDPERALDLITRRLLSHVSSLHDYKLWTDTALAVTELFGDGGTPASDAVLRRATSWAETRETGPGNVAVAVLLCLAGKTADQVPGEDFQMPALLRATGRSPCNVEHAALLWRLAIDHPKFATDALRGLRMLAQHVGNGSDGGDELTDLVTAIPRTTRHRRTLTFEIRRWTEDKDNPFPPISRRLQEALSRGEDR